MPSSVSDIRDRLKTRLETIPGLRVHDTVPSQINPPVAVIRRRRIDFDSTMARGSDDFIFVVSLFVQLASDPHAQDALDEYLAGTGTKSVKAAIEGAALGGDVDFARVTTAEEDGIIEYAGGSFLAVDFLVDVTA